MAGPTERELISFKMALITTEISKTTKLLVRMANFALEKSSIEEGSETMCFMERALKRVLHKLNILFMEFSSMAVGKKVNLVGITGNLPISIMANLTRKTNSTAKVLLNI